MCISQVSSLLKSGYQFRQWEIQYHNMHTQSESIWSNCLLFYLFDSIITKFGLNPSSISHPHFHVLTSISAACIYCQIWFLHIPYSKQCFLPHKHICVVARFWLRNVINGARYSLIDFYLHVHFDFNVHHGLSKRHTGYRF